MTESTNVTAIGEIEVTHMLA